MEPTTLENVANVAQVAIGVAALVSLIIGIATLRNTRREQRRAIQPRLAFDVGGQLVDCKVEQSQGLAGIDPGYAKKVLGGAQRTVRTPKSTWGGLGNHGGGVALDAEIQFFTGAVEVKDDVFKVSTSQLGEFPYDPALNSIPAGPSNIHPGKHGMFARIPMPMYDYAGGRDSIEGVVVVSCEDILGRKHHAYQHFLCSNLPAIGDDVVMTFGERLGPAEIRERFPGIAKEVPGFPPGLLERVARALQYLVLAR